ALVAVGATGPRDRLIERVAREQAKAHRNARVERRLDDPARGLAADVLEVRRAAADDAAQRDDGLMASGLGQPPARQRQLPGAGHEDDRDAIGGDTALHEPRDGSVEEALD